jgi:rhodanese-related sulfurtransferase
MSKQSEVQTVNVHDMKQIFDTESDLTFIDVRQPHEWQQYHIPHALHIPMGQLKDTIQEHVSLHSKPIYLYCQGGVRSLSAAQDLINLGYTHVYSMNGGLNEWAMNGYPVEQ